MQGNLVIAHGGGPTAVINASLAGVISEAKRSPKIDRVYAAKWGIEGLLQELFVDLTDMSTKDIERLKNTPSSAIGTCRYKIKEQDHKKLLEILKNHRIQYFLYTGGNDSMDTCSRVSSITRDIRVVGIPKTIDNDLAITDHCPGYGSAARYYALTTLELGLDVAALNIHVSVLEAMGRNTGWLTASTALATEIRGNAPHLIYLPERPFNEDKFLDDVQKAWDRRRGLVVAVSEGLVNEQGIPLVRARHETAVDGFGHVLPGNVSQYLAELVSVKLNIRARSEKPGLIGRASKALVSDVDLEEAFTAGSFAVKSALEDRSGIMVVFHRISGEPYSMEPRVIDVSEVANVEKKMPDRWSCSIFSSNCLEEKQ